MCSLPLQGRLSGLQQQLSTADRELQQLRNQMRPLDTQEKTALGHRVRAGHKVSQLQVRRGVCAVLWTVLHVVGLAVDAAVPCAALCAKPYS